MHVYLRNSHLIFIRTKEELIQREVRIGKLNTNEQESLKELCCQKKLYSLNYLLKKEINMLCCFSENSCLHSLMYSTYSCNTRQQVLFHKHVIPLLLI
jgi:hypothetical protein